MYAMQHPPPGTINSDMILIYNVNARHRAGRFAFIYFPGEILFQLTKVNKHAICYYKSISYDDVVFAFLWLENTIVNKICCIYEPIYALTTRLTK